VSRNCPCPKDPQQRATGTVIGFSDAETEAILALFEELDGRCDASRARALAFQLSEALEGFMGIDKEALGAVLLAQYHKKTHRV
jgi:hypothetical protein